MSTATAVKERPILYSAPMVKAILGGIKSQTRRVVNPQPPADRDRCWVEYPHGEPMAVYRSFPDGGTARTGLCECRYGKPGERLWVRETFIPLKSPGISCPIAEAAYVCFMDGSQKFRSNGNYYPYDLPSPGNWRADLKIRPSIHMPRWASRITLEITEVRVERAHDISDADIVAEGIAEYAAGLGLVAGDAGRRRELWAHLWDGVNGKRDDGKWSWDNNPWTWVISFRRLEETP